MKGFRTIVPDRVFHKLKKIPKDRQKQILNKIELISKSPEILDIKKMEGRIDTYRLRVGDYELFSLLIFLIKL